jgi:3,4-dihydroxy 2-butanone 4-phosphate synthase / GTP cyclohydrolase II
MTYETPGDVEQNWKDAISSTEEIIAEGRMFILVDHEDRENEGDLVIPAQMATPEAINFMATHGRGLICLSLPGERIDALGLQLMSTRIPRATKPPSRCRSRRAKGSPPAFPRMTARAPSPWPSTRQGRGRYRHAGPCLSAARARGRRAGAGRPYRGGGRCGAACRAEPSGVICEIMNEDGTMARLPDLVGFAQRHGLKIGTIIGPDRLSPPP